MGIFQFFTTGLMVVSLLTGLVTEAIKKIMVENGKEYKANTLAGIVSVILAPATCVFYAVNTGTAFNEQFITGVIALTFMSWLCSMVGYDKVVQTFAQFKVKEDENKNENN